MNNNNNNNNNNKLHRLEIDLASGQSSRFQSSRDVSLFYQVINSPSNQGNQKLITSVTVTIQTLFSAMLTRYRLCSRQAAQFNIDPKYLNSNHPINFNDPKEL